MQRGGSWPIYRLGVGIPMGVGEGGGLISAQIVQFRALFIVGFMCFLCTNRLQ